jgi:hypothetical protein
MAFLYGYLSAAVVHAPRVEDPEFRAFVRRELRQRTRSELAQRLLPRAPLPLAGRGR